MNDTKTNATVKIKVLKEDNKYNPTVPSRRAGPIIAPDNIGQPFTPVLRKEPSRRDLIRRGVAVGNRTKTQSIDSYRRTQQSKAKIALA